MKVLAVDTATSVAAVAVAEDGKLLGEFFLQHKKTHSQKLMPMIQNLMDHLELTPKDIDVFAASVGPGSFTGLRIGVTTIKAMAYAVEKEVIGVSTLEALAYNLPKVVDYICPMLDARNSNIYTALYQWQEGQLTEVIAVSGMHIADWVEKIQDVCLKDSGQKIIFLGDGVALHHVLLKDEIKKQCIFASDSLQTPRASSVAQAAFEKLTAETKQDSSENCFTLTPFYLRKSQAERELEKKNSGFKKE